MIAPLLAGPPAGLADQHGRAALPPTRHVYVICSQE
jgi:hypothetical protein